MYVRGFEGNLTPSINKIVLIPLLLIMIIGGGGDDDDDEELNEVEL